MTEWLNWTELGWLWGCFQKRLALESVDWVKQMAPPTWLGFIQPIEDLHKQIVRRENSLVLPSCLSWDISLLPRDWDLYHQSPGSQAFKLRLNYTPGIPDSPPCRQQICKIFWYIQTLLIYIQYIIYRHVCVLSCFSGVQLFATPWTVDRLLCLGISRQEYWSGLPCPPPGNLPDPGIKPGSSTLQAETLLLSHLGRHPYIEYVYICNTYV